jgi:protein O-mannosyl-transferase
MVRQAAPAVALNEEQRQRLASLGYVGGGQSGDPASAPGPLKDIKDMLGVKQLDTRLRRGVNFGTLRQDEVVEMTRELVRRSPETADFQNRLGAALLDSGKLEEASGHLTEALRIDPELVEAHVNLGRVLARQRKPEEAIPHFTEALRLDPEMPEAHFSMGNALAEQHRLDTALGHYAEAVRLRPDYTEAHYQMAIVLTERHKLAAAAEHYTEVLRVKPEAAAHYDLANVLREQGKTPEAIEQYTAAVRLRPKFIEARNNLGLSLAEQGKLAEAREQLEQALVVKSDFAKAHFNLGRVLAREGKAAEAAKHFARAIQLRPEDGEFTGGYAWFLATGTDPRERDGPRAVVLAEKACKLTHERDARIVSTLAAAYAEAGRFTDAVDAARRAIRVAHASEQEPLIPDIEQRLQLYESGRPFHESAAVQERGEPQG